MELQRHVRTLVEPALGNLGFDLVAVEWRGSVLRLSIDRVPGGVGMQDVGRISHHVSALLDADDPIAGSYKLEVSSPGIERPVQRLDDFTRFKGYRAKIRLVEGYPRRRFTGVLAGTDDQDVLIDVDGTTIPLAHDSIERAHLVLELNEYQKLADGLPPLDAGRPPPKKTETEPESDDD